MNQYFSDVFVFITAFMAGIFMHMMTIIPVLDWIKYFYFISCIVFIVVPAAIKNWKIIKSIFKKRGNANK